MSGTDGKTPQVASGSTDVSNASLLANLIDLRSSLPGLLQQAAREGAAAAMALQGPAVAAPPAPLSAVLQTPRAQPVFVSPESPFSLPPADSRVRRPLFPAIQRVPVHSAATLPVSGGTSAVPTTLASPTVNVSTSMGGGDPQPTASVPRRVTRKVHQPEKFSGTTQEKLVGRDWLEDMRDWMQLVHEGEDDRILVMIFGNALSGTAGSWFRTLSRKALLTNTPLTLQMVFDEFLRQFDGGIVTPVIQEQYNSLTYGQGKCKDLDSLNAEFDRLASLLFPGLDLSEEGNRALAAHYQMVIQRGNLKLWAETLTKGPRNLDEWKRDAQISLTVMEQTAAAEKRVQSRAFRGAYQPSTASSSYSSAIPTGSRVSVHQLQADQGDADVKETWERQEREQPSDEELQEFRPQTRRFRKKGSAKNNSKPGESKSKWGSHVTSDLRDELRNMNKCFLCYKRGHWAPDCPDLDKFKDVKKRRQPTDVELKA
jgi:hypothetical protein